MTGGSVITSWGKADCNTGPELKGEDSMRIKIEAVVVLCLFTAATAFAQGEIEGRGTANYIPVFTGTHTVGNSVIYESNGNIGINSPNPNAKFEVKDFRDFDALGQGPSAVLGLVTCQAVPNIACAGVTGDANEVSVGAIGVQGRNFASDAQGGGGVLGLTFATSGFSYGARGDALGTTGTAVGVLGQTFSPDGWAAYFVNRASGNIMVGVVSQNPDVPVFRVDGTGKVYANGGFQPNGADFAESMAVTGDRNKYVAGDLLVIDPSASRRLALAQQPYSTLVAGIYSTRPGMLGSTRTVDEPPAKDEVPLAVVGIVPCKVTTENGAIQVGDLLVTSSTPGHAMKGTDRTKMLGAVVGKALEPLQQGAAVIPVLVTLQ
jgi:hypothetical protein